MGLFSSHSIVPLPRSFIPPCTSNKPSHSRLKIPISVQVEQATTSRPPHKKSAYANTHTTKSAQRPPHVPIPTH
jgi:hypothetical protein